MHPVIRQLEDRPEHLKAHWCLPREEARFLYLLVRIGQFRNLLEVGTSIGYSTLHLAYATSYQQEGHLISIDASTERQRQAEQYLAEAGLLKYVTLSRGDALQALQKLAENGSRFDFIFLDARKSEYIDYLAFAENCLVPGGVLVADNTQSHRVEMEPFIQKILHSPLWEASDLKTPHGLILARRCLA